MFNDLCIRRREGCEGQLLLVTVRGSQRKFVSQAVRGVMTIGVTHEILMVLWHCALDQELEHPRVSLGIKVTQDQRR